MNSVISLTNDEISVLQGTCKNGFATIGAANTQKLPKNVVDNGKIVDMQTLRETLMILLAESGCAEKKAGFVFESSRLLFRELVIPAVGARETREIVKNELQNAMGSRDSLVCDYVILQADRVQAQNSLMAFAIESSYIASYLELFESVGVKCAYIDTAPNCVAKAIDFMGICQTVCCVISLHNESIDIRLIDNGFAVLSRSIRLNFALLLESDTLEVAAEEISDNINTILQFQKTRDSANNIEVLFLSGDFDKINILGALIENAASIPCMPLENNEKITGDGQFVVSHYINAFGALIGRGKK